MIKNYALIRLYLVILKLFNFFNSLKLVIVGSRGMPSSGLEPETSPLPRECSTAELQGLKKSGPGWTNQDCLQHSNSEVCKINLNGLSVAVKLFLGSAVTYHQSTFLPLHLL